MKTTRAPLLIQFWTPAHQQDFSDNVTLQNELNARWTTNLDGFTRQGITGNPWNETYASDQTAYFNPLTFVPPSAPTADNYAQITWSASPGRIAAYFPTLTTEQRLSLADTGYCLTTDPTTGIKIPTTFGYIPAAPCQPVSTEQVPYGPYGPRGWQDEYCEWSVERDDKGNIVRVDITCENPEYWNTLWMISPQRVCDLYRSTLGKPQIQLSDLYLRDAAGQPVIDPSTSRPAYNPFNKWNTGPFSSAAAGGAMHLTSTPNTLQTEINLASSATVQRSGGPYTEDSLLCCAQYGQLHRNSDPHIGFQVNQTVGAGYTATLTNPPGLYIQAPNFSSYAPPAGHEGDNVSQFWTVVRGTSSLTDEWGNQLPGNFILHAKFEVPKDKGYTISDITINGVPIKWGGQIIQTITMQIIAMAYPATAPAAGPCVGSPSTVLAQPLQLFHANVFTAMYGTGVSTVNFPMSLVSNSTLIAPLVEQGNVGAAMVLTCATVTLRPNGELPTVAFTLDGTTVDTSVTAKVITSFPVSYAVPGNTYPSGGTALSVVVSVAADAPTGLRGVFVTNPGQAQGAAMPALLNVVAKGLIGGLTTKPAV